VDNDERLSALIGDIYDAAIDPSLWPVALVGIREHLGGCAAAIYAKDAGNRTGNLYYDDGGLDPKFVQLYFDRYVKLDPATTRHYFAEIDEPTATDDIIPYEEFVQTRFYREWVLPQNLLDHLTTVIEKSVASVALFGVFLNRAQPPVDDEMRRRMRYLAPHVRRATTIGKLIDWNASESAALSDALDGIGAGTFLVDARSRIVHTNTAGYAMLETGRVVRATDGRLVGLNPEASRALHDVILASGRGDASVGTAGIAIPLQSTDGDNYVAHLLPLTSGARRRAGATYAAVAAVFVRKAVLETPSPPEIIARTYGLTPSELRVLLAVVEGGGVAKVAAALGVGETTVRFHLRRLFEKTDTHRQADLIKLVAGFANPFSG